MITAQLILSGTPQELQEALIRLNGSATVLSKFGDPMTEAAAEVLQVDPTAKKKTTKQTKLDLPKEEPEAEEATVSVVDLRSEIQAKAKVGKRDDIKKLLKEFGAASVTELDEDHYGEFKLKLDKL